MFRFDDLDLGAVARAFALLRLPRLKELYGKKPAFKEAGIDTAAIPFKDKAREKARQKQLAAWRAEAEAEAAARPVHVHPKKKAVTADDGDTVAPTGKGRSTIEEKKKLKRKRLSKHARLVNEWERFGLENSLAKKVKQGKMTQEEFEAALRGAGAHRYGSCRDDGHRTVMTVVVTMVSEWLPC